jgi:lysophospholipid acyltransferase (LPLAT)-like uncharacterized protein
MTISLDTAEQQRINALRILEKKFQKGDQVRYVPEHAKGDTNHPDCQTGIIVSLSVMGDDIINGVVAVRYFRGQYLQATAEMTAICNLRFWGEGIE